MTHSPPACVLHVLYLFTCPFHSRFYRGKDQGLKSEASATIIPQSLNRDPFNVMIRSRLSLSSSGTGFAKWNREKYTTSALPLRVQRVKSFSFCPFQSRYIPHRTTRATGRLLEDHGKMTNGVTLKRRERREIVPKDQKSAFLERSERGKIFPVLPAKSRVQKEKRRLRPEKRESLSLPLSLLFSQPKNTQPSLHAARKDPLVEYNIINSKVPPEKFSVDQSRPLQ